MLLGEMPRHPVGVLRLAIVGRGIALTLQNLFWTVLQGSRHLIHHHLLVLRLTGDTHQHHRHHQREFAELIEEFSVTEPEAHNQRQN